jgi:hypothetical protein
VLGIAVPQLEQVTKAVLGLESGIKGIKNKEK